jgi:hypothetical protein
MKLEKITDVTKTDISKVKKKNTKRDDERLVLTFIKKAGSVSDTCAAIGISRQTFYRWMQETPELETEIENAKEALIDFVETKLLESIKEGNVAAIMFFLKTKGKGRGYVERTEITGGDGERLFEVQVINRIEDNSSDQ